jgi:predicted ester cyclase
VRTYFEDFDYGRLRRDDPRFVRLSEICTDDYEISFYSDKGFQTTRGLESFQQMIADAMFPTWSSIGFTVEDMIAEGDRVAAQIMIRGTLSGDFRGHPARGRSVTFPGNNVLTVRDAKVSGERVFEDFYSVMRQIGALP